MRVLGSMALLFILTACSAEGDGLRAETDGRMDVPACSDQWAEGETVTDVYAEGCADDDGIVVVAFTRDCADGGLFIQTLYGYGIVGQEVRLTAPGDPEPDVNSPEYQSVQADCQPAS